MEVLLQHVAQEVSEPRLAPTHSNQHHAREYLDTRGTIEAQVLEEVLAAWVVHAGVQGHRRLRDTWRRVRDADRRL